MDSAVFNFQFLGVGGLKVLKKLPLLQWGSKFCLILSRCFLDAGGACQLQQYLFVFQLALRPFLTSFRSYFIKRTTLMDSAFFKFWFLVVGTLKVLKKYSRVAIFVSCNACQLKQYLSSSDRILTRLALALIVYELFRIFWRITKIAYTTHHRTYCTISFLMGL